MLLFDQDERVTSWVASITGDDPPPAYASIGYERDGKLQAGVYFDGATKTNVYAHIASLVMPVPQALLVATCVYAYEQCRASRLTFMVRDDNYACLAFVRGMGAELEARLRGAHEAGDVLLFALWADSPFVRRLLTRKQKLECSNE